ncbi:MAG: hypothetical protein KDC46_13970, partial [Thermoleophilia bacterium]|nr:hypothetical protein [Thermoleophilia bacterium]
TLTSMVTGHNPVGTGWGPHMDALAGSLQAARDTLLVLKPDTAADLGAKLGTDVIKLAAASGSLTVMARQRATLSEGWSSFLDTAIANAGEAVKLLSPVDPPKDPDTDPAKDTDPKPKA